MTRRDDRRPLPPDVLASALQDRITPTSGRLLAATPVRRRPPMTDNISDIRARWAGRIGAPWSAEADGSHRGRVRDATGETIAETWCTAHDDAHGAEVARLIAAAPADTMRLLAEIDRLNDALAHVCDEALADMTDPDAAPPHAQLRTRTAIMRARQALR